MGQDAFGARPGVVADEGDAVDVAVLHALDHAERFVPPGEHLRPLIELFQQQIAHRPVRLVDQHVVGPAVEESGNRRIDVGREHMAAALPLRGAGQHIRGPGHAGGTLHVRGDEDLHIHQSYRSQEAVCTGPDTTRSPRVHRGRTAHQRNQDLRPDAPSRTFRVSHLGPSITISSSEHHDSPQPEPGGTLLWRRISHSFCRKAEVLPTESVRTSERVLSAADGTCQVR